MNIDLVGPLPVSQGYTYLLTIVDRFTRWPEAIPLSATDALSCARAFVASWVARFGVPLDMTSDRGPQFVSSLWKDIANLLGMKLHHTSAFHPQSNGLVERFHRHLKSALRARLRGSNWSDELPWALLGIRTAPKEDLKSSSAELVYGAPLTVPGDFIASSSTQRSTKEPQPRFHQKIRDLVPVPTSANCSPRSLVPPKKSFRHVNSCFYAAMLIALLQCPYEGPFRVLEKGDKTFKIEYGTRSETVSIDRLKPAHLDIDQPACPALPRRRGRPPKDPVRPSEPVPTSHPVKPDSQILIRRTYSAACQGKL